MSVTLVEHNFVLWSALTCKDLTSISRILCNKSYFHCVITIALLLSLAEKVFSDQSQVQMTDNARAQMSAFVLPTKWFSFISVRLLFTK